MKLSYKSLSIFIGIGYFIIGILIIVYKKFFIELEPEYSWILGGLLIVYGFYRAYRATKYIRQNEQ
ncbi:C4-dicarboxylate ABC transporter [Apibacter sp. B2912]|uniref:C4-dicarboxylate ABC transporter n=1 Tax=Apibacter sp. B2912 TaxID=2656763 RepID=UPI00136B7FB2|nr:C4-dicarboxylate ABC transporter [Apibacter sp. B2912]MXO31647.1 C4-dicarboxylate ABC transporter [Apibacter sp. B2912]